MKRIYLLIWLAICLFSSVCSGQKIDLSGSWKVVLDATHETHDIHLPGTTDDAGLGVPTDLLPKLEKPQLTYLTRKHSHNGIARYSREVIIPKNWKNKQIRLKLERVLWKSEVYVDEKKIEQSCNSLVAPHIYNLTNQLTPGKHILEVRVDNTKQYDDMLDMTHAYTEHTQIRWNGILGEISLTASAPVEIARIEITPMIDRKAIAVKSYIQNHTSQHLKAEINYTVETSTTQKVSLKPGETLVETVYVIGENAQLWSEFNPHLYTLSVQVKAGKYRNESHTKFGLREFTRDGNLLKNNHVPVFLRGTLECCIFPLTGYPPTTKEEWMKIIRTAKEWGLNHLRFHSWCPPSAAFEAADEMGFYLQAELPVWSVTIGKSQDMTDFLYNEGRRISKEYGNHPSFCMFSLGNELQGKMDELAQMVTTLKKEDPRRLYTTTSFTFESGHGSWPEKEDDYFITQWTKNGWVRGQGVFNNEPPSFNKDYTKAVTGMQVPLITHEIGQYAVYPDIKEIEKYTGVLTPLNFIAIKEDLQKKGMINEAEDFLQSSGKLAALLYKEEIERALKTGGISGFQLLDLHDFPGQGTALVGLLNAFWENKGAISAQEFRSFCAPVVPLLRFPKAIYTNDEKFVAGIEISNYSSAPITNQKLTWQISDKNGQSIRKETISLNELSIGHNINSGNINIPLSDVKSATKLTVSLSLDNTDYRNQWNIWVYPAKQDINYGNVMYTRNFDEAKQGLAKGKTVLYNPDWRHLEGIEGKFVPVFWSPVHFPKQAGTMGVLCNPRHEALKEFPTNSHTDWQWWDLNTYSTTFITDSIQGGSSIISMIDNFTNNRRLSSVYEGRVGKGRIIISSIDLTTKLEERPVARQLLYSLLHYMNSADFNPKEIRNFEIVEQWVREEARPVKESAKSIY